MAKIGRKLFFDKTTGNILVDTGEMQGDVRKTTVDQDIATFTELSERNRNTFDVKELVFGERASEFSSCSGYRVNPQTKELEFSYPNPDDPQTPITPEKSLPTQIEELKAENELLKTGNVELRERDATIQNDQLYILETLIEKGIIE